MGEWAAKSRNHFMKTKRQLPVTAQKIETTTLQSIKIDKRECQNKTEFCSITESEPFQRSKNLSLMRQSLTGTTLSRLRNSSLQRKSLVGRMSGESSEDPCNNRSTPTSARSDESGSSGYESSRSQGRKMPGLTVSKTRSSSCLTSQEKDFEAWKKRKDAKQTRHNQPDIQRTSNMMNRSIRLKEYTGEFKRTNSFHHDPNGVLDSDRHLSSLDNLVVSTSANVSRRLCEAASRMLTQMNKMVPEGEEDMLDTIETLGYLLDDTELSRKGSKWNGTSEELAGTLKNLKKLEQFMDILSKILNVDQNY